MPKIPTINAGLTPASRLNVRANPQDFGSQVGGAVQQFGQAVGNLGDMLSKVEKKKQSNEARNQIHAYRAAALEDSAIFVKDNPAATQEEVQKHFDEFNKQYQTDNPFNKIAKDSFPSNISDIQRGINIDAIHRDSIRNINAQVASFSKTQTSLANVALLQPDKIDDLLKEYEGQVTQSTMLNEKAKNNLLLKGNAEIVQAHFNGLLQQERFDKVQQEIKSGQFKGMIDETIFLNKAINGQEKQKVVDTEVQISKDIPDINKRIDFLNNPSNVKKLGLNITQVSQIQAGLRAQRTEMRVQEKLDKQARREQISNDLSDGLDSGDTSAALDALNKSDDYSITEKIEIRNAIAAANQPTDPRVFENADSNIDNGVINEPSQIDMLSNISHQGKKILKQRLKEATDNQGKPNYFKESLKLFDIKAKKNKDLQLQRPFMVEALSDFIRREKITKYSPKVIDEAQRLLKDVPGSGFFGFGGDTGLEQFTGNRNKDPFKVLGATEGERNQIEEYLKNNKKPETEDNVRKLLEHLRGG